MPTVKPVPQTPKAFRVIPPPKEKIGGVDIQEGWSSLGRRGQKRVKSVHYPKGVGTVVGIIVSEAETIKESLQRNGVSAQESNQILQSLLEASVQSVENKWDPEAKGKIIELKNHLTTPGGYEQNKDWVDDVTDKCLPKAA